MQLAAAQLTQHLQKGLRPLYTLHGDEPLLIQEAADAIRAVAREQGYTERTVHTVAGAHFDWSEVLAAGGSLSLFADKQIVEIRIPSGKPGKDGSPALQQLAESAAGQRQHPHAGAAAAPGQDDQERRLVRRAGEPRRDHPGRAGGAPGLAAVDRAAPGAPGPAGGGRRRGPADAAVFRRPGRGQPAGRAPGDPEAGTAAIRRASSASSRSRARC